MHTFMHSAATLTGKNHIKTGQPQLTMLFSFECGVQH